MRGFTCEPLRGEKAGGSLTGVKGMIYWMLGAQRGGPMTALRLIGVEFDRADLEALCAAQVPSLVQAPSSFAKRVLAQLFRKPRRHFRPPVVIPDAETALALDWYRVGGDIRTATRRLSEDDA